MQSGDNQNAEVQSAALERGRPRPASNVWYVHDLVRRANEQRDPEAFSELYERYSPRIYAFLCQHLNGRTQEAEDLTAEIFTKVYEKIDSYQFRGVPFSSWLFRVARNHLIDHVRRQQPRPEHGAMPLDSASEVAEPGAAGELDRQLTNEGLRGAMRHLTEEQRQVIELRYLQGLSTQEAADAVGKSEEAAKKLQARGLAALKRAMDCPSGCWRPGELS